MIPEFINRHRAGVLLIVFWTFSVLCMTLRVEPYVVGFKMATWYLLSPEVVTTGHFFHRLDALKGSLFRLIRVDGENAILREQNAELAKRAMERDALELENNRLRELLDLKHKKFPEAIPATVVAQDWREWFHSVVIDKGSLSHIVFSAAVVSGKTDFPTLVGRIIEVSDNTSKILLITDAVSQVSAGIEGKEDTGLLQGLNKPFLALNYLGQTTNVQPGDKVTTVGLGGVFPPGIPIGTVEEISSMPDGYFKTAKIIPFAKLTSVRDVLVLQRKEIVKEDRP